MPKDATPNGDAPSEGDHAGDVPVGPRRRVSEMQAKLHRWAAADPGRRFDDLFNLVHDPATLIVAWDRVATNRGATTAGSDGWTVTRIEAEVGVAAFLDDLRAQITSYWTGSTNMRSWLRSPDDLASRSGPRTGRHHHNGGSA